MICKIMVLKEDYFFVSDGSIIFFSATIAGCTKLKIAPIIVAPIRRLILNIQYTQLNTITFIYKQKQYKYSFSVHFKFSFWAWLKF